MDFVVTGNQHRDQRQEWEKNLVADHLSRLIPPEYPTPIRETFPDAHLFAIQNPPWFSDIVSYLVCI